MCLQRPCCQYPCACGTLHITRMCPSMAVALRGHPAPGQWWALCKLLQASVAVCYGCCAVAGMPGGRNSHTEVCCFQFPLWQGRAVLALQGGTAHPGHLCFAHCGRVIPGRAPAVGAGMQAGGASSCLHPCSTCQTGGAGQLPLSATLTSGKGGCRRDGSRHKGQGRARSYSSPSDLLPARAPRALGSHGKSLAAHRHSAPPRHLPRLLECSENSSISPVSPPPCTWCHHLAGCRAFPAWPREVSAHLPVRAYPNHPGHWQKLTWSQALSVYPSGPAACSAPGSWQCQHLRREPVGAWCKTVPGLPVLSWAPLLSGTGSSSGISMSGGHLLGTGHAVPLYQALLGHQELLGATDSARPVQALLGVVLGHTAHTGTVQLMVSSCRTCPHSSSAAPPQALGLPSPQDNVLCTGSSGSGSPRACSGTCPLPGRPGAGLLWTQPLPLGLEAGSGSGTLPAVLQAGARAVLLTAESEGPQELPPVHSVPSWMDTS